jgi:hypothetical protein
VKKAFGDGLSKEIEKAVGRVISNIDKVGSHRFQRIATMGFISSSIVEGTNVGIKRGLHATKANMNIDMSGNQMLQQVDQHSHKRNMQLANGIHRHKNWSSSLTKDILTTYQEGLAVKNYDSRDNYWAVQQSATKAKCDLCLPYAKSISWHMSIIATETIGSCCDASPFGMMPSGTASFSSV